MFLNLEGMVVFDAAGGLILVGTSGGGLKALMILVGIGFSFSKSAVSQCV